MQKYISKSCKRSLQMGAVHPPVKHFEKEEEARQKAFIIQARCALLNRCATQRSETVYLYIHLAVAGIFSCAFCMCDRSPRFTRINEKKKRKKKSHICTFKKIKQKKRLVRSVSVNPHLLREADENLLPDNLGGEEP